MSPENETEPIAPIVGADQQPESSAENIEDQLEEAANRLAGYNEKIKKLASAEQSEKQRQAILELARQSTGKPIEIGAAAQNQAQAGQAEFGLEVQQDESRLRDLVGTISGARLQPREKGAGFDLYYEDQATHEERLIEA